MITWTASQQSYMGREVLGLCQCWKITRRDGAILRFTDHDRQILFEGELYYPTGGANQSATQKQTGFRSRNRDMIGVLTSAAITDDDLRAGRYQDAQVDIYLITWEDGATSEYFLHDVYWIDDITFNDGDYTATLTSVTSFLEKDVGGIITRDCRHNLGDARCQVALGPFTTTGEVTAVVAQRLRVETDLTDDDGYYNNGVLTWTSGANDGLAVEIRSSVQTDGVLLFWLRSPFDIEVGDTFSIVAGCNKLLETCRDVFDNVVNFGGYPHVPGTDKLRRTPDSR